MKKILLATLVACLGVGTVQALEPTLKAQAEAKLIDAFGPRLKVRVVEPLANKQLLEVVLIDGSIVHMTPDMNFFLYNDALYQFTAQGPVNITESRLNPKRAAAMKKVKDSETVLFAATGQEKARINVFTDIECGFCQKLHQEVPRLNELGIAVRYLAYPRAGISNPMTGQETSSYRKINAVWCSANPTATMTQLKNTQHDLGLLAQQIRQGAGSVIEKQYSELEKTMTLATAKADCKSPVAQQFELGHEMGVTGTPAIITQEGVLIPGYMPADDLARRIGVL